MYNSFQFYILVTGLVERELIPNLQQQILGVENDGKGATVAFVSGSMHDLQRLGVLLDQKLIQSFSVYNERPEGWKV